MLNYSLYPADSLSKEAVSVFPNLPPHAYAYFTSKEKSRKLLVGKKGREKQGVAFLEFHDSLRYLEVDHCCFVGNDFSDEEREALINEIERQARQRDVKWIAFRFEQTQDTSSPLKTILLKKGYLIEHSPFLETEYFHANSFNPPWFFHSYPLHKGFTIELWKNLPLDQEELLRKRADAGNIPPFISPFNEEKYIQPINSVFLQDAGGNTAGWMITHTYPLSAQIIDYSSYFIEREYRGSGMATALLQKSLQLQFSIGKPLHLNQMRFEVNFKRSPKSWISFIRNHLEPFSTKVTYSFFAKKQMATSTKPLS